MSNGLWIVVGSAVGAAGAILAGLVDRLARGRSELVDAAARWLAATQALALVSAQQATYEVPPSNAVGRALDAVADAIEEMLGSGRVELLRALIHRPLIRRVEGVADRVWETTSRLVLVAPLPLLRELEPHLEALGAWLKAPGDADLGAKWETEAQPAVVRALRRWTQPRWRRLLRHP